MDTLIQLCYKQDITDVVNDLFIKTDNKDWDNIIKQFKTVTKT